MAKVTREFLASLVGKTIRFNSSIENWEIYAEPKMRAVVTKFYFDDGRRDPVHKIWVDFSPFEEENHKLQNANYYDSNGNATLTAVEAGCYRSLDDIYIDFEMDQLPFEIVKEVVIAGSKKFYRDDVLKILEDFPDRVDFANSDSYANAVDKWYKEITS